VRTFAKNVDVKTGTAETVYDWEETLEVLNTISNLLSDPEYKYDHEWQEGDFSIMDNRAVAHFPSKGS
jgi:alpha-ketoglutarate-dependent taurine dioxygenase